MKRVLVTGWGEVAALEAAIRIVQGAERRGRLRSQIRRRLIFQRDLMRAVTGLGGAPARRAAASTRFATAWRRIRELLLGPHEGDAYAVCARATARAERAYAKALALELPADVRFGVERQYVEVEWDARELRRLRWGAPLTPPPGRKPVDEDEQPYANASGNADDELALEVWSDEGGRTAGRPGVSNTGVSLPQASPEPATGTAPWRFPW